jgi:hypothetical protein
MVRSVITLHVLLWAAVAAAQAPTTDRPAATAGTADAPKAVQQPAPQQPPAQQPAAPMPDKSAAASKVTYIGCVKPGTAPETWILENAEVARPGQTTTATSGGPKLTFNLATKVGTDLKPHADHKIEVVGTVAPAKPGAASDKPARQEITVESVKMVSTSCP